MVHGATYGIGATAIQMAKAPGALARAMLNIPIFAIMMKRAALRFAPAAPAKGPA